MTPRPYVSVVIPTYQRAHHVPDVIATMLAQPVRDIEVIVADDGSTDGTGDAVRQFEDPRVHYLQRPHLGMPRILNEALTAARGVYIMTCHDHDIYAPSILQELAGCLDRFPSAAYAHCGVEMVDAGNTRVVERHVRRQWAPLMPGRTFLEHHLLPGLDSAVSASTMVRASALKGRGLDPAFGFVADVELWLRLAVEGDVAYVARPLVRGRLRDAASQLHGVTPRLALHALRAKRGYLHLVADSRRQRRIAATWRRQAAATVLSELLRAQGAPSREARADLEALAREAGSSAGRVALQLADRLPGAASVRALGTLRWAWRACRGAGRP